MRFSTRKRVLVDLSVDALDRLNVAYFYTLDPALAWAITCRMAATT